jgi:hypothetical protein
VVAESEFLSAINTPRTPGWSASRKVSIDELRGGLGAIQVSGKLVYTYSSRGLITFALTHNVRSTISVVIVAGACGIAAGTPLAILGGIGRSGQLGSIIKGGLYQRVAEEGSIDDQRLPGTA